MAVLAIPEFDDYPLDPEQWYRFYHTALDRVYEQILQAGSQDPSTIVTATGADRTSGLVTLTTTTAHGLAVGDTITVAGVTDPTFDGEFVVASVPSTTSITYDQSGADATSGSGTITPAYPRWQEVTTGRELRADVRVTDTLVRSKYAGRDYQTFLDEGLSWLAEKYGDQFTDFVDSDFGIMFVKYVSSALDTLSWYMDKEVSEWYYSLMRLRSRAEELARMSAYKPRSATACTADLTLTLDDGPYAFDITVPERFQFQGPNSLIFEITQDVTFAAGETTKTGVPATQGQTLRDSVISDAAPNFQLPLTSILEDTQVAQDSVEVYVDGQPWEEVDFLPFAKEDKVEVLYGADPPFVLFGDGVSGNIPDAGLTCLAIYRVTYGKAGLAATAGTIEQPVIPLVANSQSIAITANNPSGARGGVDLETLEEIVKTAPAYFKTADRGTTTQDMTTLADSYSSGTYGTVAKGKAHIVRGISDDLQLQALLASIDGHATDLETAMTAISTSVDAIATARGLAATQLAAITTAQGNIDTNVTAIKGGVTLATEHLETAKEGLENIPYQQVFAQADGATKVWNNVQLQKGDIYPGTVFLWVDDLNEETSVNDGNCDVQPGRVRVGSAIFEATDVGRQIKIGDQFRTITKYTNTTEVTYSGSLISGTNLEVILYEQSVYARDDGAGNLSGPGVVSGAITYSTGLVDSLELAVEPPGTGQYGSNILIQFGATQTVATQPIDNAITELDAIDTTADSISDETGDISDAVTEATTQLVAIATQETTIDTAMDTVLAIPASIEDDVEELEAYLDANLSADCKANIVMVQVLVVDENGFYAAPSQTLLTAVQEYLDERNVLPTTVTAVNGYYNLVAVNMLVQVSILKPYLYSKQLPSIQAAIDAELKGRDYGVNLNRSDYYNRVVPDKTTGIGGVEGVDYANITITATSYPDPANTGTPPSVDANGNLVIPDTLIITRGTITYEEIV